MSVNWLKVAQKMAEDARAQLAINSQRLWQINTNSRSSFIYKTPLLDPDAISKALQPSIPRASAVAAARQVLVDARNRGFEVVLVYIGTENVEINLARIRNRVLAGGHDVPESDVRRRYQRSFKSLPMAIERADHTILFDNSTEEGYRLIAVLGPPGSQWFEPVPGWAKASRS